MLPEGSVGPVEVHDFAGCRGLRCTAAVDKGEVLLSIPEALALVVPSGPGADHELASQLLKARAEPRFALVPADFGLPCTWSSAELAGLDGSLRRHAFAKQRAKLLEERGDLEAESYLWARCAVASRSFEIHDAQRGGVERILAPGLDLLNHDPQLAEGPGLTREDGRLVIRAARPFAKGEQAVIKYGAYALHELIGSYGFAPADTVHDRVDLEVDFDLEGKSEREMYMMLAAPEALTAGGNFEFMQTPGEGSTTLSVRFGLTLADPVPPSLLSMARVQRMTTAEFEAARTKQVVEESFVQDLQAGRSLGSPAVDLPTYAGLLKVVRSLEAQYTGATAPKTGNGPAAAALATSERAILAAAARKLTELIDEWFVSVLAEVPVMIGEQWLPQVQGHVAELGAEAGELYGCFAGLELGTPAETAATWVQTAAHLFRCIHGTTGPAHWAVLPARIPGGSDARLAPYWADFHVEAGKYGETYLEKMALWGTYLCAQFVVSGGLNLDAVNTMQQEVPTLQRQFAYSIPTKRALDVLAEHGPLVEVGAGTGYWASLLQARGVDVVAANLPTFNARYNKSGKAADGELMGAAFCQMTTGGPEKALGHEDRALVLMWPDYEGQGSFASDALDLYEGSTLLLVGEWADHTLGALRPTLPATGQSFSASFQQEVEAQFKRVDTVPLPGWPLNLDTLAVYKRK